ncbi:hypothetical protein XI09_15955 [Bradyrhizobium sp. CCBAU 11386]|nr:hypothetical protein [Bradyrhizobium sp. CCBAU 11386]
MIQILSINAETLAELLFRGANRSRVNPHRPVTAHEKGGVRIAEAAFRAGKTVVLARFRFTAR